MIGQPVVADRGGVLHRVGRVDAVDLGALEQGVAAQLRRAQRGGGVGREERVARAAGADHHPALLHVADRAPADVRLAHRGHGNCRQHAGLQPEPLEHALHGESIDDGRQHAHVVGDWRARCRWLAATVSPRTMLPPPITRHCSTPQACTPRTSPASRLSTDGSWTKSPVAHQSLPRHLQEHPAKAWGLLGRSRSWAAESPRAMPQPVRGWLRGDRAVRGLG